MKRILLLSSLIGCSSLLFAQIAFFDAKQLKDSIPNSLSISGKILFKPSNDSQIILFNSILKSYLPDSITEAPNDSALFQRIQAHLKDNPFIELAGMQQNPTLLNNLSKSLFTSGGVSFGIPNATAIADGIGKFLAKRTKQELKVLFFDRLREFLNTHPEVAQLFPSTTVLLNTVLNQEYPNLLSTLRAAFDSDLKAILRNIAAIPDIDENSACSRCLDRKKANCKKRLVTIKKFFESDRGTALIAGLLIADGAISKQNPATILSSIVENNRIKTINGDLYNALSLLDIFSESLRSDDPLQTWISTSDLNSLINDPITLGIYLALVYEQVKNAQITIGGQSIAVGYIKPQNVASLKLYIGRIQKAGKKLESSFRKLKETDTSDAGGKLEEASQFVGAVQTFFDVAIQYNTINPSIPKPGLHTKQIFLYVDSSLSITQKILSGEYYGAILSATVLLENILQTRNDFNSEGELIVRGVNEDIALTKKQFLRAVLRYGNFAADVVSSTNSDDVEKAIETVALPPGSSLIKRTTNFNISFQAYTGFVGGNIKDEKGTFNSVSVYAPLGIAFSFGLRPAFKPRFMDKQNPENKRTWGSLTFFGSIIDVGAVVAYRFYHPDEKLSDSVNVAWSNIFAPGINLVYGISKWPISIGFGAQYQATLRRFDAATTSVVEKSGLRYNFFFALDLPILNLYTSKK